MNCFLLFPGLFKSSQTCRLQQPGELAVINFNDQQKNKLGKNLRSKIVISIVNVIIISVTMYILWPLQTF